MPIPLRQQLLHHRTHLPPHSTIQINSTTKKKLPKNNPSSKVSKIVAQYLGTVDKLKYTLRFKNKTLLINALSSLLLFNYF